MTIVSGDAVAETQGMEDKEVAENCVKVLRNMFPEQVQPTPLSTLMLLVANLANKRWCKKSEKWLKLSESAQQELSYEYHHYRV